jgi:hypothetical protein
MYNSENALLGIKTQVVASDAYENVGERDVKARARNGKEKDWRRRSGYEMLVWETVDEQCSRDGI